MKGAGRESTDSGFALLIVLWTIGLLALIGTTLTATGRLEAKRSANLRDNAVTEAAADGAVFEAALRLAKGDWRPDGNAAYTLRIGRSLVRVRLEDEGNKVNPNTASRPVLESLLRGIGIDRARASSLAAAIIDWRTRSPNPQPGGAKTPQYRAAGLPFGPPGRRYASLDELGLVLGMTPDLFVRLKPYLSIYANGTNSGAGDDPLAPQSAAGTRPTDELDGTNSGEGAHTVAVEAEAVGPGQSRFTRRAIVRVNADADETEAVCQILTWDKQAR